MVGDWSLSGRNLDRMRLRWKEFQARRFPCATEKRLGLLYDELIEWDGEVGDCIRLLLSGRRVNLGKLRDEREIRARIDELKACEACHELLAMETYYEELLLLIDDSMRLAARH